MLTKLFKQWQFAVLSFLLTILSTTFIFEFARLAIDKEWYKALHFVPAILLFSYYTIKSLLIIYEDMEQ